MTVFIDSALTRGCPTIGTRETPGRSHPAARVAGPKAVQSERPKTGHRERTRVSAITAGLSFIGRTPGLRGPVMAADYVVGAGGGNLGSLEAGAVGALIIPVISALAAFRRYRFAAAGSGR